MAQQDARAVDRYLRKDAATANLYKIDPTQIFVGGVSAGAFNGLNVAYLTSDAQINSIFAANGIDSTLFGDIEGSSGSAGYSSKAKAVINLCGAIAQVSWIPSNGVPLCSMHGTADSVVPFDYGWVSLPPPFPPGTRVIQVYGSEAIDSACKAVGVESDFHAWIGAPHVPFDADTAYFDSVLTFVTPFLFAHLTCNGFTGVNQFACHREGYKGLSCAFLERSDSGLE
jgi:acetyl esterase/lipase